MSRAILALSLLAALAPASVAASRQPLPAISISKLTPPDYPRMARLAGIAGDVVVSLRIRPDGTVESARADVGPAMLIPPTLASAREASFLCSGCTDATTPLVLTYTYTLQGIEDDRPFGSMSYPRVEASGNHITVEASRLDGMLCDPALLRVRSPRCVWLWPCAIRPSDACDKEAQRRARLQATPIVPTAWIDLPLAPLVARQLAGRAVLSNRSGDGFDEIRVGCVVNQDGRAHVQENLGFTRVSWEDEGRSFGVHLTFRPGDEIDGLLRFARFAVGVPTRACRDDARVAVTATRLGGMVVWSAEGTPWPR